MKAWQALACGFVAWNGCAGTETGNPYEGEQEVHLAYAPLATSVMLMDGTPVMIDGAAVRMRSIALEACDASAPLELAEPRQLELLEPSPDVASVPAARYCGLRIALGSDADRFSASRARANGEISAAFSSQLQLDARVRLREPVEVGNEPIYWIVGVDLQQWVEPLDAWLSGSEASFSANGDNTELIDAIVRSLALYDDVDQDGEADEDELSSPALSTVDRAEAQVIPGAI